MSIYETITKPTLLIDVAAARKNIHTMCTRAHQYGIRFRPHFKTHQSVEIGEWFRQEGVGAITVSSVDMASRFAEAGWQDITIAFPVNLRQMDAINRLNQQVHLELVVESFESARYLNAHLLRPVNVWVKIDVGTRRTGIDIQDVTAIRELCLEIASLRQLNLTGMLTHAGQTYKAHSREEICALYRESIISLNRVREQLAEGVLKGLQISVGDTPGNTLCEFDAVDEIRPGNFVFFDAQQLAARVCYEEQIAVALACPVVAKHPQRQELVVYGGAVHLSKDSLQWEGQSIHGLVALPGEKRWGKLLPGAAVTKVSQEHGVVHMPLEYFEQVEIGSLICVVPAHSCLTVQAMGKYLSLDGEWIATILPQTAY